MEHLSPSAMPSHNGNGGSEGAYIGIRSPRVAPKLNTSSDHQDIQDTWKILQADLPWNPSHPCYAYAKQQEEKYRQQLVILPPNPYHNPSVNMVPEMSHLDKWNKCHLLSLPKELRLEIWKYTLTDPSAPQLLVDISRCPSSPYLRHSRPRAVKVQITPRNPHINAKLLEVNRFIYEEALPILYKSAKFAPSDLEGLLPLFLDTLSPYARSCIRHVRLHLPVQVTSPTLRLDPSRPFFHWAVTCAQVAKINSTLQEVEIEGDPSIFESKANRRAILSPLCKIKAAKKFTPRDIGSQVSSFDETFQVLLAEVAQHLKENAKVREERTKADALKTALEAERLRQAREAARIATLAAEDEAEELRLQYELEGKDPAKEELRRKADLASVQIDDGLEHMAGFDQFERELKDFLGVAGLEYDTIMRDSDLMMEDWDMVSVRSGASTPKARRTSVMSTASDGTWADTASTIVEKDDDGEDKAGKRSYESDRESEAWEQL